MTTTSILKHGCTNLLELSPDKVVKWLNTIDRVVTDCDGVLWLYSNLIAGSSEAINRFKELGKKVYFCTNNSTTTQKGLHEKAQRLGFDIAENEIISTAHSTAAYLKHLNFQKKVYIIGMEGIAKELDAVGIEHTPIGPDTITCSLAKYLSEEYTQDENVGAVIIGFDDHFSFPKMIKAAAYLSDPECLFIATNTDERFPMPNFVIPATGCFVRAVQLCADREPIIIGKPNKSIVQLLLDDKMIDPARTLMIGDRCNTDILLGHNCGFQTLLVGTGVHQLKDVAVWQKSNDPELKKLIPDAFLPKLGDIVPFLSRV